ncbi:hypothetical protein LSAT2_017375 [Lamellibrachia satsuma]|nr:hypothetical protein LSAT2_017375 [Lamellibrachia satsuma]
MLDIPKQRLKHLVASAILDLWKKETGSLSSVIIEGTICITSHGGRTTVIQVANRFTGLIPEGASGSRHNAGFEPHAKYQCIENGFSGAGSFNQHHQYAPPHVDCHNSSEVTAYFDELSPASLVSPNADQSNCTDYSLLGRDSRPSSESASQNVDEDSVEDESIAQMGSKLLGDSVETESTTKPDNPNAGPVCPGTGYYTREGDSSSCSDDSDDGMKIDESVGLDSEPEVERKDEMDGNDSRQNSPVATRQNEMPENCIKGAVTPDHDPEVEPERKVITPKRDPDTLDLNQGDTDLALSTPQSYTAQVRDVIRQRLLAGRRSVSPATKDELSRVKPDGSTPTPSVLKNVGLQRSGRRKRSFVERRSPYPGPVTSADVSFPVIGSPSMFTPPSGMLMPPPTGMINGQFPSLIHKVMPMSNGSLHTMLKKNHMNPLHDSDMTPASDTRADSPEGATDLSGKSTNKDVAADTLSSEPQKIYRCEFCTKTFLFKSKYHEHLPVHTNARPFQCHLCSRTYKYKYDLRVHLRTHMGIPTKSTVCPFCTSKFDTNKLLRLHIRDDHNEHQRVSEDECTQPTENLPPAL